MTRASRPDNRYSRFVGILKVSLPILSVAILAALFLAADRGGGDAARDYVEQGATALEEGNVSRPTYAGISDDGTLIALSADVARPDRNGVAEGDRMSARLEPRDGAPMDVVADTAELTRDGSTAVLTGAVRIASDDGYDLLSDRLDMDLLDGILVSPGPVVGSGPPGRIDAAAMQVDRVGSDHIIQFTGGVNVQYAPPAGRPTP